MPALREKLYASFTCRTLALCGIALITPPSACRADPPPEPAPAAPTQAAGSQSASNEDLAEASATPTAVQPCGVCYAHAWQGGGRHGYGTPTSADELRYLAELGVETISITPFGYMPALSSTTIGDGTQWPGGETWESMRTDAALAHELGMTVMHKPHLWIGRGEWRATIDPNPNTGGWDTWFDNYHAFIVEHAEFAEEVDAEWFVIGVELESAVVNNPDRWLELIAAVRDVYSGQITYASNWDETARVPFWAELDAVGVQMFAPLSDVEHPTYDQLLAGAEARLTEFEEIAEAHDRPLVLTEVGYANHPRAAAEPFTWPERLDPAQSVEGERIQLDAYRAIYATFGQSERVERMYWWKWFTHPNTTEESEIGFSPRHRPALEVMRAACGG